jgi:hypothetical protein
MGRLAMSRLQSLLEEARAAKGRIAEFDNKIASLRAQIQALESQPVDLTAINLADEGEVLSLASRELRLKALPAQINAVDLRKGDALRGLAATADLIRRELMALAQAEQQKTISDIADVIEPFCGTSAENFASGMPVVLSIGNSVLIQGRPISEANQKREESDRVRDGFDRDTLAFVNETLDVADRYVERGTFILDFFVRKKR